MRTCLWLRGGLGNMHIPKYGISTYKFICRTHMYVSTAGMHTTYLHIYSICTYMHTCWVGVTNLHTNHPPKYNRCVCYPLGFSPKRHVNKKMARAYP